MTLEAFRIGLQVRLFECGLLCSPPGEIFPMPPGPTEAQAVHPSPTDAASESVGQLVTLLELECPTEAASLSCIVLLLPSL